MHRKCYHRDKTNLKVGSFEMPQKRERHTGKKITKWRKHFVATLTLLTHTDRHSTWLPQCNSAYFVLHFCVFYYACARARICQFPRWRWIKNASIRCDWVWEFYLKKAAKCIFIQIDIIQNFFSFCFPLTFPLFRVAARFWMIIIFNYIIFPCFPRSMAKRKARE